MSRGRAGIDYPTGPHLSGWNGDRNGRIAVRKNKPTLNLNGLSYLFRRRPDLCDFPSLGAQIVRGFTEGA